MRYYAWDRAKAESNYRKHRVRFETALEAFDDPDALTITDRIEGGEWRCQTLGMVGGTMILFVAHTEEDDDGDEIVRIISARIATRLERRRYEAARSSSAR
jgi:hypothetical protein